MSDGFLSRWLRRKDEARRAAHAPPRTDAAVGQTFGAAQQRADEPEAHAGAPHLGIEEIAGLPKIDELTAESDITCFLRRGVPAALRNAALRKMWMLDPAIRDFVGHARDYSYDWNTPGGVPGSGTLEPSDVAAMVRRILGERDPSPSGERAGAHGDHPGLDGRISEAGDPSIPQSANVDGSEERRQDPASERGKAPCANDG